MSQSPDWSNPSGLAAATLLKWWEGLEDDKGGRARLRRAEHHEEVIFIPAYHDLCEQMAREGFHLDNQEKERLAMIAGLASHVRGHVSAARVATQLAQGDGRPSLSDLRFRRLLAIEDDPALLYQHLRRAIDVCDRKLNLTDLALGVARWGAEMRKTWAYLYYETAQRTSKS